MTEVGGATYVIDAKIDGVKRGMAAVKSEFREVQKEADRAGKNGAAAMRAFGGSIEALAGASADPAKIARNWSRATGQLASDMGRFSASAKQQGITFAELTQRLIHFRNAQFQATKGRGELFNVLKRYDVEAATALRLSSSQAQSEAILSAALARTRDATVRAKIEAAAYGLTVEKAGQQSMIASGGIGLLGKTMAAFLTAGAATAAFQSTIQAMRSIADIGDLAANIGMSTAEVQGLQYALVQTGMSADEAAKGLDRYGVMLSEARRGEGFLADLFEANNIALKEKNGELVSSHTLLMKFADLVKNAATAEDALNMSVKVFGKEAGRTFIEAVRSGSEGLIEMARAAEDAGVILTESQIAAAAAIEARYNDMMFRLDRIWKQVALGAVGAFESIYVLLENTGALVTQLMGSLGLVDQYSNTLRKSSLPAGIDPSTGLKTGGPLELTINGGTTQMPAASRASKTREERDAVEEYIKSLNKEIEALELEIETYGLSNAAKARAVALAGLGAEATDAQRAAVLAAADAIAAKTQALDDLKAAEEEAKERAEAMSEAQKFLSDEIKDSFFSILHGTESVADAFQRMAERMIDAMLEAVIFGEGPFAKLLGMSGGSSGGGGLLGSLLGGLLPKAAGGSASGPVLVGEEGPELLNVPGGSTITPNEHVGRRVSEILATTQRPAMSMQVPVVRVEPKMAVVINNNAAGADVTAEERRLPNGDRELLVMVDQRVARQMSDPYSQSNAALTARGAAVRTKRR